MAAVAKNTNPTNPHPETTHTVPTHLLTLRQHTQYLLTYSPCDNTHSTYSPTSGQIRSFKSLIVQCFVPLVRQSSCIKGTVSWPSFFVPLVHQSPCIKGTVSRLCFFMIPWRSWAHYSNAEIVSHMVSLVPYFHNLVIILEMGFLIFIIWWLFWRCGALFS